MSGDVLEKVKAPATGLIVAGGINAVIGLLILLGGVYRLSGIGGRETLPTDEAQRMGFMIGTVGAYAIALLSLVLAPLVIYGAVQMMKGNKYGLAKASAILAIVPLTSCCFLVGIPMGIWALVVLGKPEIKGVFDGTAPRGNFNPPQPPPAW